MLGKEGPELPASRPTLAMTHPELYCLGEQLLLDIMDIIEEGDRLNEPGPLLIERLPDVLSRTIEFIEATLSTRGPNDGVAYWAEQTFKAVQRIEKGVLTPPMTQPTLPILKNKQI